MPFAVEEKPCAPPSVSSPASPDARVRVFTLTVLVIVLGVVGNLCLSWGMKHVGLAVGLHPLDYIRVMFSPFVALGVALLIFWLLTRMVLLSQTDLSFVLPATAVGYVLNAFLALWLLNESLDNYQWLGTLLICVGAGLVGSDLKPITSKRIE